MRVIYLVLALGLFSLAGCKSNNNINTSIDEEALAQDANSISSSSSVKVSEKGTITIDKAFFIENIMDYEKNPRQWIYKGDKPCLIDFYADWCGPCRITSPILEELAEEYKGKINIYKIDTEVERELSYVFGVRSLPTFMYCPANGLPEFKSGIARSEEQTKQMFRANIDEILLKSQP